MESEELGQAAELADSPGGEPEEEENIRPPVHYSTGRLTRRQAETVNAWRARLAEDKPLPGEQPVSAAARMMGLDDRPRASCSDALAAAVRELLAAGRVEPMALARYAHAGWQAQRLAARTGREPAAAPVYPPVSWYLPVELADLHVERRATARRELAAAHQEVADEAVGRYPHDSQAADRRAWFLDELARRDIPSRIAQVPRGALARMAIDAWARLDPDAVCAAAVAYAAEAHEQPHRGRRDMRKLRR